MDQKRKKTLRHIIIAVASLGILLTILNLYLTNRLERYLQTELVNRTSDATDGFYSLKFDKLSISFLTGELRLEGIDLRPDSAVFREWASWDSLPKVYVQTKVDVIDFRGVNLVWRVNNKQLHFRTFEIKSPEVEVFQSNQSERVEEAPKNTQTKTLYELVSHYINVLTVKTMNLENARISYAIRDSVMPMLYTLDDVSFHAYGFRLDSLSSQSGKLLYCDNFDFVTHQPQTLITNNDLVLATDSINLDTRDSLIHIGPISLRSKETYPKGRNYSLNGNIGSIAVHGIWFKRKEGRNFLTANSFDIHSPHLNAAGLQNIMPEDDTKKAEKKNVEKIDTDSLIQTFSLYPFISPILHSITINHIGIDDGRIRYAPDIRDSINVYSIDNFDFKANGLIVDSVSSTVDEKSQLEYLSFSAEKVRMPVDNGFYTLKIDNLRLDRDNFTLSNFHLESRYPMGNFSYKHPKHADWFNIKIGHVELKEIDIQAYFSENTLRMKQAIVNDMLLENFKNQKIRLPRRIVPMVYEGIQKAPVKIDIPQMDVQNFTVNYYELARNGDKPGKLSITDVNGRFTGLTNIVTSPEQFIQLDAEARFMGKGYFTATWMLPVDPAHDQFLLQAHLVQFDLTALNEFITPLAGAEIVSGQTRNFAINMDASSKGGTIHMRFPYQNLKVNILKDKQLDADKNSFTSFLVNTAVRNNNPPNPDKADSKLRESQITIVRDPYHSTFNYLWQMLRPSLTESVGIGEGTQKFGKGVMKVITGIKNIFKKEDKDQEKESSKSK